MFIAQSAVYYFNHIWYVLHVTVAANDRRKINRRIPLANPFCNNIVKQSTTTGLFHDMCKLQIWTESNSDNNHILTTRYYTARCLIQCTIQFYFIGQAITNNMCVWYVFCLPLSALSFLSFFFSRSQCFRSMRCAAVSLAWAKYTAQLKLRNKKIIFQYQAHKLIYRTKPIFEKYKTIFYSIMSTIREK